MSASYELARPRSESTPDNDEIREVVQIFRWPDVVFADAELIKGSVSDCNQ